LIEGYHSLVGKSGGCRQHRTCGQQGDNQGGRSKTLAKKENNSVGPNEKARGSGNNRTHPSDPAQTQ
jgi:hypothetical protein